MCLREAEILTIYLGTHLPCPEDLVKEEKGRHPRKQGIHVMTKLILTTWFTCKFIRMNFLSQSGHSLCDARIAVTTFFYTLFN